MKIVDVDKFLIRLAYLFANGRFLHQQRSSLIFLIIFFQGNFFPALPVVIASVKSSMMLIIKFKAFQNGIMKIEKGLCMFNNNIAVNTIVVFPMRFWNALNRSEEHTSELQSHVNLVCRLLLEK